MNVINAHDKHILIKQSKKIAGACASPPELPGHQVCVGPGTCNFSRTPGDSGAVQSLQSIQPDSFSFFLLKLSLNHLQKNVFFPLFQVLRSKKNLVLKAEHAILRLQGIIQNLTVEQN